MGRLQSVFLFVALSGCAQQHLTTRPAPSSVPSASASVATPAASSESTRAQEGAAPATPGPTAPLVASGETDDELDEQGDGEQEEENGGADEEGESHDATGAAEGDGLRYTRDLSDDELKRLWTTAPEQLGTLSLGFVDEGRLVNAKRFPPGEGFVVVSPEASYATDETISYLLAAISQVHAQFPDSAPLRVNQLSAKDGGHLRPHKSHQNGRDVDLGFYYRGDQVVRVRERERYIDPARNWALMKALVTLADVQLILVDKRVQKVLYEHALASGEPKEWLDSLFRSGKDALIKHARRHRDHFHVRFFNPRAQELGRRVTPLLALRPEQNVRTHRVRSGDTLGAIARKYGSSVPALMKANRLKSSFLRLSQVLQVPLRGPCTRCPVPPAVVLPKRRLPPTSEPTPEPTPTATTPSNPDPGPHATAEPPSSTDQPSLAGVVSTPGPSTGKEPTPAAPSGTAWESNPSSPLGAGR